MDLTGEESQDWRGRGYIEAASTDGSDVELTGTPGDLPDDVDDVLDGLLTDHDVSRYPEGAVLGWFAHNDLENADIRDPSEVEVDPYPFDSG